MLHCNAKFRFAPSPVDAGRAKLMEIANASENFLDYRKIAAPTPSVAKRGSPVTSDAIPRNASPFVRLARSFRSSPLFRVTFLSAASDGVAAVMGFIYVIASTRVLYGYFGVAKFGIWATVFSLTAALAFMDFGLGNAAVGALARAYRRGAGVLVRTVLLALVGSSFVVAAIILVILQILIHFSDVEALFSLKSTSEAPELRAFLSTFAWLLAANFPINAMGQATRGLQRAWAFNSARAIGFLTAACGVVVGSRIGADLIGMLLLSFGLQLSINAIVCGALLLVTTRHPGRIRPSRARVFAVRLMTSGGSFVLLNLARTFGWLLDYAIVAHIMGPTAAASLAIMQRMFQIVQIGYAILGATLWPIYAYLKAGHEFGKLKRLFALGFSGTVLYALTMASLIFVFRERIAHVWLGASVAALTVPYALYGVFLSCEAAGSSFSVLLNAQGIVARQAFAALIFAGLSFAMKLWLVPQHGLEGLTMSTLIAYGVGVVVLLTTLRGVPIFVRKENASVG